MLLPKQMKAVCKILYKERAADVMTEKMMTGKLAVFMQLCSIIQTNSVNIIYLEINYLGSDWSTSKLVCDTIGLHLHDDSYNDRKSKNVIGRLVHGTCLFLIGGFGADFDSKLAFHGYFLKNKIYIALPNSNIWENFFSHVLIGTLKSNKWC